MKGILFTIEGTVYRMPYAKFEKYQSIMTDETEWNYRLDWIIENSKKIDSCFVYNY